MTALLELRDLHVAYGPVEAVRGVSLSVTAGRIVSVIGPNGAGKTTLLAAAIGLLPMRGKVLLGGEDLTALDVEDRVSRGLALVPESRELFGDLSVRDNLVLGGYPARLRPPATERRLREQYERFPRLGQRQRQKASTLSGGERQMLALARAMMREPAALALDEAILGLAPRIMRDILAIVAGLRDSGVSILLVEQNARAALAISDEGCVLENGEKVLSGEARGLADDPRVRATYLGGSVS